MAPVKRQVGLSDRIPPDVLARTRKANVEDVDGYAGRLEAGYEGGYSTPPAQQRRALYAKGKAIRKADTAGHVHQLVATLQRVFRGLPFRRAPRTAGHR